MRLSTLCVNVACIWRVVPKGVSMFSCSLFHLLCLDRVRSTALFAPSFAIPSLMCTNVCSLTSPSCLLPPVFSSNPLQPSPTLAHPCISSSTQTVSPAVSYSIFVCLVYQRRSHRFEHALVTFQQTKGGHVGEGGKQSITQSLCSRELLLCGGEVLHVGVAFVHVFCRLHKTTRRRVEKRMRGGKREREREIQIDT